MNYEVQIVGDDDLPKGVHKVIVERVDGVPLLIINGEPARCWRLMRAWEDTLEPSCVPSIVLPAQSMLYAV